MPAPGRAGASAGGRKGEVDNGPACWRTQLGDRGTPCADLALKSPATMIGIDAARWTAAPNSPITASNSDRVRFGERIHSYESVTSPRGHHKSRPLSLIERG
ncbi:hypothetical protein ACJJTC_013150 [Scirpophaga incertulas]